MNLVIYKMEQKQTKENKSQNEERMVRILSTDIEGKMKIYPGLAKIKGVSWGLSKATCEKMKLDKNKKIGQLTEAEIKKITDFLKNPDVPAFLKNRRKDFDSGEDRHLVGSDLELRKDFDIKRLKKIKSYRGLRHLTGQPSRGQRTKAHFRTNKKRGAGIKKKKVEVTRQ